MRQILLCSKQITDVLLLILFFVVFFSLLGESYYSSIYANVEFCVNFIVDRITVLSVALKLGYKNSILHKP